MKWRIGRQAGLLLKREKEHLLGEDKMKTREGGDGGEMNQPRQWGEGGRATTAVPAAWGKGESTSLP